MLCYPYGNAAGSAHEQGAGFQIPCLGMETQGHQDFLNTSWSEVSEQIITFIYNALFSLT